MSLLLDALKKAAQAKQSADSADLQAVSGNEPELLLDDRSRLSEDSSGQDNTEIPEELELDELYTTNSVTQQNTSAGAEQALDTEFHQERVIQTPSTVTDEALQLLIHKTNIEHKKSRIMIWSGVVVGSLVLLSIGGLYFYFDMMNEMESMQRKHRIALATLKSKTRIEENLTSLAVVPESSNKKESSGIAEKKAVAMSAATKKDSRAGVTQLARQTFSVQRAEKRDPVSEALQRGWNAYQNKAYESAMLEYEKVLDIEPENHDALLGKAAVALQQDDPATSRELYIKLLERDPRDPHAHAGLANIAQTSGGELSETRLKQLIEFRPDDSHLQFALGNLYIQKKSWPEAQRAFFNAWKVDNSNPDYAYNLAVSLDHLGKYREARAYYEDSLKLATGKNISFSTDAVKNRLAYLGAIQ